MPSNHLQTILYLLLLCDFQEQSPLTFPKEAISTKVSMTICPSALAKAVIVTTKE